MILYIEKKARGEISLGYFDDKKDAINKAEAEMSYFNHSKELHEYADLEMVVTATDERGEPSEWEYPEMTEEEAFDAALDYFRRDVQFLRIYQAEELEDFIKDAAKERHKTAALELLAELGMREKDDDDE